ncbi:uncharacterized protein MELLADRAFT_61935 [Melampsora larici-populina 98AG31]|uniref:Uncharacterized protein n=1 Tax=Melampsora larici-populina (strain 98AG31 / pathotype 3-4-7) TaxID=747676 RepID=F4RH63_MELLP|nr:uncharacterized protein MELLADRAFT_61935 [Melampsora larici-populina 98AG31]EGG08386.1 hypothetical protein MELLADRAFT_61935 [Melampsora larici-populina 98AG31]
MNNAKQAFESVNTSYTFDSNQLETKSCSDNGSDDLPKMEPLSKACGYMPNDPVVQSPPTEPVKDSLKLRLNIKRPAPASSPIKSVLPLPQKLRVVKKSSRRPPKSRKRAVNKEGEISVEVTKPVVKVEPKAKSKVKGERNK